MTLASVATSPLGVRAGRSFDAHAPGVIASLAVAGLAWLVVLMTVGDRIERRFKTRAADDSPFE